MRSSDSSSRKTRVSVHLSDAAPAEGEIVSAEGWLTYYDEGEKSWKPLKGKLHIYIDGVKVGESESNNYGMFSFPFTAPREGKHKLEVRFKGSPGYDSCYKSMDFQTVRYGEKKRLLRLVKIVFVLLLLLVILSLLSAFMVKLRPP